MGNNYYTEQLAVLTRINSVFSILAAVFLLTAIILAVINYRWKKINLGKKLLVLAAGLILISTGGKTVSATSLDDELVYRQEMADIQILWGDKDDSGNSFRSQVGVGIFWRSSQSPGGQSFLHIQREYGNSTESMEMDPGYGTSVTEQLQYLGIPWITITAEAGSAESAEGKMLQFVLDQEGSYYFTIADRSLMFSIGDGQSCISGTGQGAALGEETKEVPDSGIAKTDLEDDIAAPEIEMMLPLFQGKDGTFFLLSDRMTIIVKEENFDPSWEPEVLTEVSRGSDFSGWKVKDGEARGTIQFKKDGEYSVVFQCCDLFGNQSSVCSTGSFTVDTKVPEITIKGVEDKAVYSDRIFPVILVDDRSFSSSDVNCSLKGARSGLLDLDRLSEVKPTEKGIAISVNNFPAEEDDVYTLSVQAKDQAGNEAREELVFSMDQYGSSYIMSDATQELIDSYYTEKPVELVLSEINASPIVYQVTVSKDGVPRELTEDEDYCVEVRGGDGDWMIYTYHIFVSNFQEEGVYHVDITSRDQASNVNNNQVRGARIDFAMGKIADEVKEKRGEEETTIIGEVEKGEIENTENNKEKTDDRKKGGRGVLTGFAGFILLCICGSILYVVCKRSKRNKNLQNIK